MLVENYVDNLDVNQIRTVENLLLMSGKDKLHNEFKEVDIDIDIFIKKDHFYLTEYEILLLSYKLNISIVLVTNNLVGILNKKILFNGIESDRLFIILIKENGTDNIPNFGLIEKSSLTYIPSSVLEMFSENEKFIQVNDMEEYLNMAQEKYQIKESEKIKKLQNKFSEKIKKRIKQIELKSKKGNQNPKQNSLNPKQNSLNPKQNSLNLVKSK